METLEAIKKRRSVKKFKPTPIEKGKLAEILEAARLAPSSGNLQNWQFIIIRTPAKKKVIAQACFEQYWMEEAPILIVICSNMDRVRRMFGKRGEALYAIQNCACAAENMMLAATDQELGSCFVSIFEDGDISNALGIPPNIVPLGILAVGYAAEKPDVPVRFQLDNMCFFENYGRRIEDIADTLGEYGTKVREMVESTKGAVEKVSSKVEGESKGIFDTIKKHLKKR